MLYGGDGGDGGDGEDDGDGRNGVIRAVRGFCLGRLFPLALYFSPKHACCGSSLAKGGLGEKSFIGPEKISRIGYNTRGRVRGTGYRRRGTGYRVQGTGCRVQGTGCRVQGAGQLRGRASR